MNVIQFRRPTPPAPPAQAPICYVTIYPNATHFRDPNRDEPDRRLMGGAMFDSTFHVHKDLDNCRLLIMIGAERTDSMRSPGAFDTAQQRAWLRRRLDSVYEQVTGQPRIRSRLATFCQNIFQGDHQ